MKAAFFAPRAADAPLPGQAAPRSPARALRDAVEPLAVVSVWAEPSYDAYSRHGLDFLRGYVWGRASALGEPEGAVVAAAFGVFEPGLIRSLYDSARAACSRADVRAAVLEGATEALREALGGEPPELGDVVAALARGLAVADRTGRPLFAGLAALEWPAEPLGQLWHACALLREYRGDGHLAVCVTEGLSGLQANLLTDLVVGWESYGYTATRGWSPEAVADGLQPLEARGLVRDGRLTDEGRRLRADIEDRTDRLVEPVVQALGDDLPRITETLDGWSQRVVDRGWFPPDPYKRASG